MYRIVKEKREKDSRKYRAIDVAYALCMSDWALRGFFNNQGISVKHGITIKQVADCCTRISRGSGIDFEAVREIRNRLLDEFCIEIIEANDEAEAFDKEE